MTSAERWAADFYKKEVWSLVAEPADASLSSHPSERNLQTAKCIIMTIYFDNCSSNARASSCKLLWYCLFCICSVFSLCVFSTRPDSFLIIFPAFCLSRQCAFLMWGLQRRPHLSLIQEPWSETTKAPVCVLTLRYALRSDITLRLLCLFVCPKNCLNMYFSQR